MTAKVITVGIQKGGAGKTTTSCVLAYMLSQKYKVLLCDLDAQGNATELLTHVTDLSVFRGRTVLEALQEGDCKKYIRQVSDTLHLLPSDDFLSGLSRWMYNMMYANTQSRIEPFLLLKQALETVVDYYDYIVCDTPPNLGEATMNALGASDWVIIMSESSRFGLSAIRDFLGTIQVIQRLPASCVVYTIIVARTPKKFPS
jgi:chromosome partitioning protein